MYLQLSHKAKQFFLVVIKLTIVVACLYYIYNQLYNNKQLNYWQFIENIKENNLFSFTNSLILVLLTCMNWAFEIIKWKLLANTIKPIATYTAITQSLSSHTIALITPNRIGEYGAKALFFKKKHHKKIVVLNLIGNFYQMFITLFLGLLSFSILSHKFELQFHKQILKYITLSLIAIILIGIIISRKKPKYRIYISHKIKKITQIIPLTINLKVLLYSFIRYVIFSHQFYFLLTLFNIEISYLNGMLAISSMYLIASIIPMLSIFDIVLKSTVAIWIFSYFNSNELSILSITTLMWLLNFVLPAIIGSYFVITFKPNVK